MHIIEGKKIAWNIEEKIKNELQGKKNKPCLATILVGDDGSSKRRHVNASILHL